MLVSHQCHFPAETYAVDRNAMVMPRAGPYSSGDCRRGAIQAPSRLMTEPEVKPYAIAKKIIPTVDLAAVKHVMMIPDEIPANTIKL